ncbi:MAG: phosphate ABC transporter substrate-binding protein [Peptococcaceae bacterium]|nr:phosphate ABC transporter substrate-binding protein [Peptococcaceae bacterium]
MRKKVFVGLLVILAVMFVGVFAAGCGGGAKSDNVLTIAGSTSVQPLSEELAKAFMEKNPGISINVQGGGSSQGIKAASQGIADIGAASRHLEESEKGMGLTVTQIALDGIALIVHPDNPVNNLTLEQVEGIFTGKITTWDEVGTGSGPITVVTREAGSGTRGAFEEMVLGEGGKITDNAIVQASNGGVSKTVAEDELAIGYVSFGYITDDVKAVNINGVEPTPENVKSGNYALVRPFNYLTKGEPQGLVKKYIDFVLSPEGQEIVAKDYVPVN